MFVHNSKPFRFALPHTERPPHDLIGVRKITGSNDYRIVLWEVDKLVERTIDYSKLDLSRGSFSTTIDSIVVVILKYRIVYFTNLTSEYHQFLEDVVKRWQNSIKQSRVQHPVRVVESVHAPAATWSDSNNDICSVGRSVQLPEKDRDKQ